jgi:hypothetical protein
VVIPPEHDAPIPTHISDALPDDTTIVAMPGGGGQF